MEFALYCSSFVNWAKGVMQWLKIELMRLVTTKKYNNKFPKFLMYGDEQDTDSDTELLHCHPSLSTYGSILLLQLQDFRQTVGKHTVTTDLAFDKYNVLLQIVHFYCFIDISECL